jgi:hypothetical protein
MRTPTQSERMDAMHVYQNQDEGVKLPFERMQVLQDLGYVSELERLPGRGKNAGRYTFYPTKKLLMFGAKNKAK